MNRLIHNGLIHRGRGKFRHVIINYYPPRIHIFSAIGTKSVALDILDLVNFGIASLTYGFHIGHHPCLICPKQYLKRNSASTNQIVKVFPRTVNLSYDCIVSEQTAPTRFSRLNGANTDTRKINMSDFVNRVMGV